ncbi:MAG: excinuclease ABC subunit UvrB [Planctomycetota bacterium]
MQPFRMQTTYEPAGDQPQAIEALTSWLSSGQKHQTLLGVTGSGKTFTMAKIVERLQRPTLVLAPNKTLAAQLYAEFREFFPDNAVEYFVSYYDYYQPEAYVPNTDTFIEKDATINQAIERMRNSATRSLMDRRDVLIVASISCIYGLGSPENYRELSLKVHKGMEISRDSLLRGLAQIQYRRDHHDFERGRFRARGDVIEVFPVYEEQNALRFEMWGDEVEAIYSIDPLRGEILEELEETAVYPVSHYVAPQDRLLEACAAIEEELDESLQELDGKKKLLEKQRLEQRTRHDLEMMRATGICNGIENYSRHLDGRTEGQPPATLLHYFPEDFMMMIDESHVAVPQAGGMFRGDRARKQTLVNYGFRLPSALDNRPLTFDEFVQLQGQVVYVSATPNDYELQKSVDYVTELVVRPTGLVDPPVEIRPAQGQVDDVLGEVRLRVERKERVLITTLTKRMAEELTDYFRDVGIRVRYLHSDIDSLERTALIRDLRLGVFDCLVGINLLREGLDIPEVTLVAVLDADREGYLRSKTSLIQTCGRAARNAEGRVILYADKTTVSMQGAIDEMERRRTKQIAHNEEHDITPTTIKKAVRELLIVDDEDEAKPVRRGEKKKGRGKAGASKEAAVSPTPKLDSAELAELFADKRALNQHLSQLREKMLEAAKAMEFEQAASLRDEIYRLERLDLELL